MGWSHVPDIRDVKDRRLSLVCYVIRDRLLESWRKKDLYERWSFQKRSVTVQNMFHINV